MSKQDQKSPQQKPTPEQKSPQSQDEDIIININEIIPAPADVLLGIKYLHCSNKKVIAEMPITKNHTQPMGILHGGITCVLAESVGSVASNIANVNNPSTTAMVGLSLVANHLRSAMVGDTAVATAMPLHLGKSSHVWDIKIHSKDHGFQICAARLSTHVMKLDTSKHRTKFLEQQQQLGKGEKEKGVVVETAKGTQQQQQQARTQQTTMLLTDLKPTTPMPPPEYVPFANGQAPIPACL